MVHVPSSNIRVTRFFERPPLDNIIFVGCEEKKLDTQILFGWIPPPFGGKPLALDNLIIVLIHIMLYPKVLYSSPQKKLKMVGFTTPVFLAYTWLVVEKNTLKNKPKSLGMNCPVETCWNHQLSNLGGTILYSNHYKSNHIYIYI